MKSTCPLWQQRGPIVPRYWSSHSRRAVIPSISLLQLEMSTICVGEIDICAMFGSEHIADVNLSKHVPITITQCQRIRQMVRGLTCPVQL
jgi:hypothetical protein